MAKDTQKKPASKAKPRQGTGLHKFIATGGKPPDYQGSKGVMKKK